MRRIAVLLTALLLASNPAQALTPLFAGGEDVDFNLIGALATADTTTGYSSSFSREAIKTNNTTALDPPQSRAVTPVFSAQSALWIHALTDANSGQVTNPAGQGIGIYGSDGVRRLMIRGTGTNSQVKISKRNTAGTFTDLVTCTLGPWPAGTLTTLDMFVNYSVSGEVTLYANNVQFCDFVGDVTTNGVTQVNQVDFSNVGAGAAPSATWWSQVIIANTDTRGYNLWTLVPNGAGNTTDWSGSCTTSINNAVINDTQFISTPLTPKIQECTVANGSPPSGGPYQVDALIMSARVSAAAAGPQHFDYVTRTGGTDYFSSDVAATPGFVNYPSYVQTINPNTGIPFTMVDLEDAGLNIGLRSEP